MEDFISGAFLGLFLRGVVDPLIWRFTGWRLFRPSKGHPSVFTFDLICLAGACAFRNSALAGAFTVWFIIEFWTWWNRDDDEGKRRRQTVRNRVTFRTFTPSPIPAPGAAS